MKMVRGGPYNRYINGQRDQGPAGYSEELSFLVSDLAYLCFVTFIVLRCCIYCKR